MPLSRPKLYNAIANDLLDAGLGLDGDHATYYDSGLPKHVDKLVFSLKVRKATPSLSTILKVYLGSLGWTVYFCSGIGNLQNQRASSLP